MEPRFDEPTSASEPRLDALQLRAGDQDRQKVADQLRAAVDEGRLTLDEYDERVAAAYAARTYRDLANLTVDLPPPPTGRTVVGPRTPSSERSERQNDRYAGGGPGRHGWQPYGRLSPWRPWLVVSLITTLIWLLAGLDGDGFEYFWPMWVIVPWGLVLASHAFGHGARRRRW
ncbi:MAG: DUF1707 SHOCT-like domain-containing protein [Micromonosporaceae bacterium]